MVKIHRKEYFSSQENESIFHICVLIEKNMEYQIAFRRT